MPSKAEFYRQMAEQVSTRLAGSWERTGQPFPYHRRPPLQNIRSMEQMMIYAQRPDATACAEYNDLWNEKMGAVCTARLQGDSSGGRFRRQAPPALCVRYFRHRDPRTFPHPLAVAISIPRPRLGRWERRSARSTSRCCGRSVSPSNIMSVSNSRKGALHMENNLTYTRNGDYLIPDLSLSEQPEKPLGKYGRCGKRT